MTSITCMSFSFILNQNGMYLLVIILFASGLCNAIFYFKARVAMEGKVEHKFDMKPHHANIEEYRKMCRERTNKSMVKNRQIQVKLSCTYNSCLYWLLDAFILNIVSIFVLIVIRLSIMIVVYT